ncbi:endoplasmic reticulum membrane-associated RNA degradation protein-like isoform X5 [Balamuthia mandrillaris]
MEDEANVCLKDSFFQAKQWLSSDKIATAEQRRALVTSHRSCLSPPVQALVYSPVRQWIDAREQPQNLPAEPLHHSPSFLLCKEKEDTFDVVVLDFGRLDPASEVLVEEEHAVISTVTAYFKAAAAASFLQLAEEETSPQEDVVFTQRKRKQEELKRNMTREEREEELSRSLEEMGRIEAVAMLLIRASLPMHSTCLSSSASFARLLPIFAPHEERVMHIWESSLASSSSSSSSTLEAMLLIVPFVERALVNVHHLVKMVQGANGKARKEERKGEKEDVAGVERLALKDLLATPQLRAVFNENQLMVMRALIATPLGLNLRNIAWHGFFSPEEVWSGFLSLIMVSTLSLWPDVHRFIRSNIKNNNKQKRSKEEEDDDDEEEKIKEIWTKGRQRLLSAEEVSVPYEKMMQRTNQRLSFFSCSSSSSETSIDEKTERDQMREIIENSFFPIHQNRQLYLSAVDAFFLEHDYHRCLVYLLPALEHSIRRVFVAVNNCPIQLLDAVMYDYYTTLDILVAETLEWSEDGSKNHVCEEIGEGAMRALWDLCICPEGPRLRDRISHGEIEPNAISHLLCEHVLALAIHLCSRYHLPSSQFQLQERHYDRFFRSYISTFHTQSILIHKLCSFSEEWRAFSLLSNEPTEEGEGETIKIEKQEGEVLPTDLEERTSVQRAKCLFVNAPTEEKDETQVLLEDLYRLPTLYLSSSQLQCIACLRKVISISRKILAKITERYVELKQLIESRRARSRQRNSYEKLTQCLPFFSAVLRLVGIAVVQALFQCSPAPDKCVNPKDIKLYTQMFVCLEKTFSTLESNKWEEAKTFSLLFFKDQNKTARLFL